MISYSKKIRDLRNEAQETQAAIKIRDKLTELKSKDVRISSSRWIWELIQNAKDCTNSTGKIDIEINFDSTGRILEFKHNGKLFSTKNIVHLIEQVSTKERTRNSESTGKFGTGFLTTNLLSPVVIISGFLHDEDDEDNTDIAEFRVRMDRSGKSIEELKESIRNSCSQLETDTHTIDYNIKKTDMNTVFTYMLDNSGIDATRNGLENFLLTAPYVFAFVPELNKITINNNGEISVYVRTKEGDTQSNNVFVSRIYKNNNYNQAINILTINDDGLMLAVEIMQSEGKNYIVRYDDKLPRLFCDFPLLGTNDFTFPVVINSRNFDPNEPRNGIILYGEESEQNKSILKKACSLYVSLIDYFLQNNYKDIYNTVRLSHVENKDWIDKIWYEKEIISLLKRQISEFQMFTMADGSKQSLCDESGFSKNIFLSGDNTKEIRESVWKLSSQLFPNKHVCYEDIDNWYNSLWNECRNYSIIQLIEETEKIGNLHKLENKISDAIEWLNRLYNLIYEQCSKNPSVSRRDNKIFPNQHGEFCYIYDLKADIGIDEAYKEASDIIGIDLRKELADKHISFKNINIISFNDIDYRMWQRIQITNIYYIEIFYKRIISMKKNSIAKQDAFIKLYNILYSDNPIITVNVNHYSELLLNSAIEYWCEKICKDIAGCNLLSAFCSAYKFSTQDNAETWLSGFVRYLKAINKTDLLDKYSVIPNQNGGFRLKPNLYIDSDTVPDFMKDVCRVAGTDFREEMVSSKTDVSQIIPRKKGYKEVSDVITNYMRSYMNNISVNAVEKEAFNKTYLWLRENKDNPDVKQHFSELIEHLYWFYNDEEISESISKANELDNILNEFRISDTNQLKNILTHYELSKPAPVTKELLCQYGISSKEELKRLIDSKMLGDDFLHYNDSSFEKFQYVQQILQRSLSNIQNHLRKLQGYDLADSVLIHKTIFTAKKDGREIYIIARPSDYNEVILYYDAEFDTLDHTKDFELWIEDGKSTPEKLTFGKILKLTGVNRIPLRRIK